MSSNLPKGCIGVPVTLYYRAKDRKAALAMAQEDMATFITLALQVDEDSGKSCTHYEGLMIGGEDDV